MVAQAFTTPASQGWGKAHTPSPAQRPHPSFPPLDPARDPRPLSFWIRKQGLQTGPLPNPGFSSPLLSTALPQAAGSISAQNSPPLHPKITHSCGLAPRGVNSGVLSSRGLLTPPPLLSPTQAHPLSLIWGHSRVLLSAETRGAVHSVPRRQEASFFLFRHSDTTSYPSGTEEWHPHPSSALEADPQSSHPQG